MAADVLQSTRLRLRHLHDDDAAFILQLTNEPSWLRYIGDKNIRSLEDARNYIATGPVASYARHGFGLYLVELREDATLIGLCGLIRRDTLADVDIGFAFLPAYWGQGHAFEAASAVVAEGRKRFGLRRLAAITDPANAGSIRVIEKLGLVLQGPVRLTEDADEVLLFAASL